jgi:hypothetical protein
MSETFEVELKLEVKPFAVPGEVALIGRKRGQPADRIPIKYLSDEAIAKLCKDFVNGVYDKAERPRPEAT